MSSIFNRCDYLGRRIAVIMLGIPAMVLILICALLSAIAISAVSLLVWIIDDPVITSGYEQIKRKLDLKR